jgi:hypothetical protein
LSWARLTPSWASTRPVSGYYNRAACPVDGWNGRPFYSACGVDGQFAVLHGSSGPMCLLISSNGRLCVILHALPSWLTIGIAQRDATLHIEWLRGRHGASRFLDIDSRPLPNPAMFAPQSGRMSRLCGATRTRRRQSFRTLCPRPVPMTSRRSATGSRPSSPPTLSPRVRVVVWEEWALETRVFTCGAHMPRSGSAS